MKFATALLALATAAMASPTKLAVEERNSDCKSCKWEHQKSGHGRHHGKKRYCNNWVPVTEELVAIDVHVEICINLELQALDLLSVGVHASVNADLDIDVTFLHQQYPGFRHLFCNTDDSCEKDKKIDMDKCWKHEFDEVKFHQSD